MRLQCSTPPHTVQSDALRERLTEAELQADRQVKSDRRWGSYRFIEAGYKPPQCVFTWRPPQAVNTRLMLTLWLLSHRLLRLTYCAAGRGCVNIGSMLLGNCGGRLVSSVSLRPRVHSQGKCWHHRCSDSLWLALTRSDCDRETTAEKFKRFWGGRVTKGNVGDIIRILRFCNIHVFTFPDVTKPATCIVSSDRFVLVSHCNLGTKEFCLTYVRPVVITYVGAESTYTWLWLVCSNVWHGRVVSLPVEEVTLRVQEVTLRVKEVTLR